MLCFSVKGWDYIGDGFIQLSFKLLDRGVGLGGVDEITQQGYNIASSLLAAIIRKQSSTAAVIVKSLVDRILMVDSSAYSANGKSRQS